MSRIRRAFRSWSCGPGAAFPSVLSAAMLIACGGDDQPDSGSAGTGGDLIFATGGTSGSSGGTGAGGFSANGGTPVGTGGSTSNGATTGGGGTPNGGNPSTGGVFSATGGAAAAGSTSTGGSANAGGGPTMLPVGSVCANDSNCSQASGAAVCCVNVCKLQADCPGGSQFLPCNSGADCAQFGGGKVCCKETSGGQSMQYCTKPSGCSGTVLP